MLKQHSFAFLLRKRFEFADFYAFCIHLLCIKLDKTQQNDWKTGGTIFANKIFNPKQNKNVCSQFNNLLNIND